jgi:hypothetical protein
MLSLHVDSVLVFEVRPHAEVIKDLLTDLPLQFGVYHQSHVGTLFEFAYHLPEILTCNFLLIAFSLSFKHPSY